MPKRRNCVTEYEIFRRNFTHFFERIFEKRSIKNERKAVNNSEQFH